jgi:2-amino-4-ketopentanoate thiolase alpha subunit
MANDLVVAKKRDLVQIHVVILEPDERSNNLPEATRSVCYEGWIKGFLLDDHAEIGQTVQIESFIGRTLTGVLTELNPIYNHNFGEPQPELQFSGSDSWKRLEGKVVQ